VVEKLFNDMECPPDGGAIELTRKKEVREDLVKIVEEIKK
jgi:hypothetical protein